MTARVGRRGLPETQPLAHWCLLSQDLSLPPQQSCCLNLSKQIGKFYKNWFMMLTFVRHPEEGRRMLSGRETHRKPTGKVQRSVQAVGVLSHPGVKGFALNLYLYLFRRHSPKTQQVPGEG